MRLALVVFALALLAPLHASATCGGGGHGGGGHGGGHGSSHWCVETSRVVGRASCHRFGFEWSTSDTPMTLELFGGYHMLDAADADVDGTAHHGDRTFAFSQRGTTPLSVGVGGMRMRFGFERFFYAGFEIYGGSGPSVGGTETNGGPGLGVTSTGSSVFGGGLILGTEVVLGPIGLRAEVAALLASTGSSIVSQYLDCIDTHFVFVTNGLLEPRVGVDFWLSPWVTLGVGGGLDVTGTINDAQVGLALAYHTRSYDGARP